MKHHRILSGLFFFLALAHRVFGTPILFVSQNSTTMQVPDSSQYVILPFYSSVNWPFQDAQPAALDSADLASIEQLLSECINEYNVAQVKAFEKVKEENPNATIHKGEYVIDLIPYKRQYVAVTNKKGEKEVWVNCFCMDMKNWKTDIVRVMDGGNCFFHVKINLTKNTFYQLSVNGMG
jgi:hypothetical protein